MELKKKEKILSKYKKKIKLLKKHDHLYHNQDNPIISDENYDKLKKDVLDLEKNYNFLLKLKLNTQVGSPPSNKFKKIKHLRPMLSLSNAFDKSDMTDFLKKINNFFKCRPKTY